MPRNKILVARQNSPLRNPFKKENHADPIKLYKEHLDKAITDKVPEIIEALAKITEDSILACWCCNLDGDDIFTKPVVCHCQIIWQQWKALKESTGT